MRNDARPVGEDAHDKSPIGERESVTHDRQSHIVNRDAEADARRIDRGDDRVSDDEKENSARRQSPR
jgi:hypothetical protein